MTRETYEQKLAKLRHDGGPIRHYPAFRPNAEMDYALELRETDPARFDQLSTLQKMTVALYEQDRERSKPTPTELRIGTPEYEAVLAEKREWDRQQAELANTRAAIEAAQNEGGQA
jgi:hypothetical protein